MRRFSMVALAVLMLSVVAPLAQGTRDANAIIHEIIGAACRAGGEEVVPPGQVMDGQSFLRALLATGVIESIDMTAGDGNDWVVTFDLDDPASKFTSAGFDLTIPNAFGPGVDLTLSPLPVPDADFAAHANCHNLNP